MREGFDALFAIFDLAGLNALLRRWNDRFPTGLARITIDCNRWSRTEGDGEQAWGISAVEVSGLEPATIRLRPAELLQVGAPGPLPALVESEAR